MLSRIVERSVVFCAALAGCLLLWRLFWFDLLPDDFGMPDYEHELEGLAMRDDRMQLNFSLAPAAKELQALQQAYQGMDLGD